MMNSMWGLFATILFYQCTLWLKKKYKFFKFLNPNVAAGALLIVILTTLNIDYKNYNQSACFLTLLLGPATIALGYPLSENIELLTKNKRAIYTGFAVGTATALLTSYFLGMVFHSDWQIITSLMPKSVTTPIALEISKAIGGIPELTACIVALTGIYGAVFGHKILKIIHIKSDIAIGLAIGAASHVLGTSSCIEKNRPKQVVMATLALIITGIVTTIICILIFN